MSLRGTGINAASAGSYVMPWPAGTVAGDIAIVFGAQGFGLSNPSGWTLVDNPGGSYIGALVAYKVLTSGDITAGSVTVSASGTYDGVVAIATLVGSGNPFKKNDSQRNPGPTSPSPILISSTAAAPLNTTDDLFAFAFSRGVGTATCNLGTQQRTATTSANAVGSLYYLTSSPPYAPSATFTYSSTGAGNYQCILVMGPPPPPSVITAPPELQATGLYQKKQGLSGSQHQLVHAPPATAATPPVPLSSLLDDALVNVPYSITFSTQGGVSPYTYSVIGGTLPPGMTLSSAGVLSGTPTTTGTYNFTVKTTDSQGNYGQQLFTMFVNPAPASNYGWVS